MNDLVTKLKTIFMVYLLLIFSNVHADAFLKVPQARVKFGTHSFSAEKFKGGNPKVRAEMAADLVAGKALIDKPLNSVTSILGKPDGYFENKAIPAYIISPKTSRKEVWQVVVLPDSKWERVSEVEIHKNCCD